MPYKTSRKTLIDMLFRGKPGSMGQDVNLPAEKPTLEQVLSKRVSFDKVKPLTPHEAELRERLNIPGLGPFETINSNLPPIERAPMFRPQTKQVGVGTNEARQIEELYKHAPQLRGRSPEIKNGYGPMMLRMMEEGLNNPDSSPDRKKYLREALGHPQALNFEGMTAGAHSIVPRTSIEMYPHSVKEDWIGTLGHEFQHAQGMLAEDKLDSQRRFSYEPEFDATNPMHPIIRMGKHSEDKMNDPFHTDRIVSRVFNGPARDVNLRDNRELDLLLATLKKKGM